MTQISDYQGAPVVRVGADVRVEVGDGEGQLHERQARRIELKLSIQNPELKKLKQRLASALRGLGVRDEKFVRATADALFKLARDPETKYGEFADRVAKAYPSQILIEDWNGRVHRAAKVMYAIQKADDRVWACRREGAELVAPRGALVRMYSELGHPIYDDQRQYGSAINLRWRGPDPRPYQQDAVEFTQKRDGITVLPCGAGKTFTALRGIADVGRRAVVLVPTKEIRDEWIKECWRCLGFTPGQVGDGKFEPDGRITIVIYATAVKLKPEKFDAVFGRCGILVIDECHHVVALKLRGLVERVAAALRWGLTATPYREDGLGQVMDWVIGPILYEATQRELAAAGFLVLPEIAVLKTEWTCPEHINPSDDWPGMITELIGDEERNRGIVELIENVAPVRNRVLVLTCRTWHAMHLRDELNSKTDGVTATAVTSEMPKRKRQEAMDRFRSGEVKVVCAVNIGSEGLNVPELDAVVIAGPVKAKSKTIQRLGRLMRPMDGKAPMLYDFVDERVPHLKRQWYARRRAYKEALGG